MATWQRQLFVFVFVACCVAVCVCGCEDTTEPTQPYDYDLGEGDTVLLPPTPPVLDAKVATGTAELPEFREPGQEPSAEEDIRTMIEELNDVVEDEEWDELPSYYVEWQQPGVEQLIGALKRILAKVNEAQALAVAKAPESAERFAELLSESAGMDSLATNIGEITIVSETLATADEILREGTQLPPGMPTELRFHLTEDGWSIEDPKMTMMMAILPMMEQMAIAKLDQIIASLQSDEVTVDQLIENMIAESEAAKAVLDSMQPDEAAGAEPPAEEEEEEPTTEEARPRRPAGTPG